MSYARLLATGSGSIGVRLTIEGLSVQFVTDPSMEKTLSDGRRRICSLPIMGEGIVIEDAVNIPEAMLEAQGTSVRILETEGEDIAAALKYRPDVERFITSTVAVGDTTINLLSTTGISVNDVVHVGTEAMLVSSVGASSITVTRAYWSTIAQAHHSHDGVVPYRALTNRPLRVRGRRAYLHLYGEGDDPQGDGTQVWIGQVTSDPRCSDAGTIWSLQIGSISERLKTKIGGELDTPRGPRGIYYPWSAPLRISIVERASGTDRRAPAAPGAFTGFYETQPAFVAALTTQLGTWATAASLLSTYRAVALGDGTWTVECTVGTGVTDVSISVRSEQDGRTNDRPDWMVDEDGERVAGTTLAAGDRIYTYWAETPPGGRRVPRGYFGLSRTIERDPAVATTYPEHRVYLDGPVSTDWTGVALETPVASLTASGGSVSTGNNSLVVGGGALLWPLDFAYTRDVPFVLRPTRLIADGTLASFRDALVTEGPAFCNRGTAPFLTTADLASWTIPVVLAARYGWQRYRQFVLAQSHDLDEYLSHEMRLLGLFPIIDSDGKIGVATLDVPNVSTRDATEIDDEIVSVGWASMEAGGQTINRVVMHTGYEPADDEWNGPKYTTEDHTSYAQDHTPRELEIKPRSTTRRRVTPEGAAGAAVPVLSLFGYPHDFVSINVSWRLFGLRCGDVVSLSAHHLPDYTTGERGLSGVVGIVVGRRWELGEAHGEIRVLIPWQNVAGYTPTARVSSQSNVSGDTWDLTVSATQYAPSATVTSTSLFTAGDDVRIIEYDSESPSTVTGTVSSVNTSTNVIRVAFDSTWTPGSSTWELCFGNHADVVAAQKRYAYIADSSALVGTDSPRAYGA